MPVTTGQYPNEEHLGRITNYLLGRGGNKTANHIWTEDATEVYEYIEAVRCSDEIYDAIHSKFPDYKIKNVRSCDELYIAVSPAEAGHSDKSLVEPHYDAPFGLFQPLNAVFYRVIVACNANDRVTTNFPDESVSVVMDTGDFHGLDYNKDYHFVEGSIPPANIRVLLKLHYLLTPPDTKDTDWSPAMFEQMNIGWTKLSRETMRMSAEPTNIFESIIGGTVEMSRKLFNIA